MIRITSILFSSALALACGTDSTGPVAPGPTGETPVTPGGGNMPNGGNPTPGGGPVVTVTNTVASLTAAEAETYLGKMAPPVVGRVLSVDERTKVTAEGGAAIGPVVSGWLADPGFIKSARRFIELGLQVSGTINGVDFDLPGNLVEYVVTNKRPWSEILTSEACYDASLQPTLCDTGAPYVAGVLTTRAYLISRASRFNLTRSSALMKNFACQGYPQDAELQPRIVKERLIPMFQANTPEEQVDERAKSGFGNGLGCYSCHGQFSLHSQLYVKFNSSGLYIAGATGLQDPEGELGRSIDGLMASHLLDPVEASDERSNMFGQEVENLKAAAKVVATQTTFAPCAARRFLDFSLGVQSGSIEYDAAIFEQVVGAAQAVEADPSLQQIVVNLLTHPTVVTSVIASLSGAAQ